MSKRIVCCLLMILSGLISTNGYASTFFCAPKIGSKPPYWTPLWLEFQADAGLQSVSGWHVEFGTESTSRRGWKPQSEWRGSSRTWERTYERESDLSTVAIKIVLNQDLEADGLHTYSDGYSNTSRCIALRKDNAAQICKFLKASVRDRFKRGLAYFFTRIDNIRDRRPELDCIYPEGQQTATGSVRSFNTYRVAKLTVGVDSQDTMIGFSNDMIGVIKVSSGQLIVFNELCKVEATLGEKGSGGRFELKCPSGYEVTGETRVTDEGMIGVGVDRNSRKVSLAVSPSPQLTHRDFESAVIKSKQAGKDIRLKKADIQSTQSQQKAQTLARYGSQNVVPAKSAEKDVSTAAQRPSIKLQPQQSIPQLSLNITSTDPKEAIEEIDLKITLYAKIANSLPQTEAGYRVQKDVLDKKIEELKKARESLAASYLSKYNTPIYPVNINLGTTAFRYSEIFPSIPYYIPGTKEVGEFLVQPVVSNKGQLTYEFTFLDPSAKYNKERDQIVVVNTDMGSLIDGLDKVREWTETAEKQNVRRRFEKVASCFPKSDCGERQVGKSSTEVVFQIYENGSTSGKLQRVKGEFVSGYNMSVESTVLLGAYLKYMRDIGEQEFKVGSMTEKDLDSLFK